MKNISIVLVFTILFGLQAFADSDKDSSKEVSASGIISGKVVDQITGEGLCGVKVSIGNGMVSYSDLDGNFAIEVTGNRVYDIQTNYLSYQSYTLSNLQIDAGERQVIRLELKSLVD